jgi:hypothetical protein
MRGGWIDLHTGQLVRQQVDLVDQYRETLRTNVFGFTLKYQIHQWDAVIRLTAIQAIFFLHGFSNHQSAIVLFEFIVSL